MILEEASRSQIISRHPARPSRLGQLVSVSIERVGSRAIQIAITLLERDGSLTVIEILTPFGVEPMTVEGPVPPGRKTQNPLPLFGAGRKGKVATVKAKLPHPDFSSLTYRYAAMP